MASPKKEFIERRAELLAKVALTRRPDISLSQIVEVSEDMGIDFFAHVQTPPHHGPKLEGFGVVVMGTAKEPSTPATAAEAVRQKWNVDQYPMSFLFPVVATVFFMHNDAGYYCWLMEPTLDEDGRPGLVPVPNNALECRLFDKAALDTIVDRSVTWAQALAQRIIRPNHAAGSNLSLVNDK